MIDRVILVFDADSGVLATLVDVVKKLSGREDCSLCELTYSALGPRPTWRACVARLPVVVEERHRDQIPPEWGLSRGMLPCVLGQSGEQRPTVLVSREALAACGGRLEALEDKLRAALEAC